MSHCWTDRSEWIEETYGYLSTEYLDDAAKAYGDPNWCGSTCLLPGGHSGPHVWTPNDEIVVTFADQMPAVNHVADRGNMVEGRRVPR